MTPRAAGNDRAARRFHCAFGYPISFFGLAMRQRGALEFNRDPPN